jgi:hypothetical protein
MALNSFHHGKSIRDIWNKNAVHDIDMKPVGLTFIDHFTFTFQVGEVGGKH